MAVLIDLTRDIRHACRLLGRAPGFTIVATLTLALGVGANTALFSVVNALLLRPLPYPEPERLVFLDGAVSRPEGESSLQLSYPDFMDIAGASSFSGAAAWSPAWGLGLEQTAGAVRLQANFVTEGYFGLLGGQPLVGRTFSADDHALGADGRLVAVISEAAWREYFAADAAVVGRTVRLQDRPFTVIGVMPAAFSDAALAYVERVDVWAPLERVPALFGGLDLGNRGSRLMWGVARLGAGRARNAAIAEMDAMAARAASEHPQTSANFRFRAVPLSDIFFADARRPLWMLLAGAVFVLLIGCANIANLLLVRATFRTREVAMRCALGASRSRIVRQLLAESLVLALAGATAGVLMAMWVTPALIALSGLQLPSFARVSIDRSVLFAATAIAFSSGLVFGLAPVWRAWGTSVRDSVAASGSLRVARSTRAPIWLAGIEITAAYVLASGALLMTQSFSALAQTDLAYRHERLLTVRVDLPQDRYDTPAKRAQFGERVRERTEQLPGVEQAILWGPSMFGRSTWVSFIAPADRPVSDAERLMVWRHSTNPGALRALGIPLIAGRDFDSTDSLETTPVAIVSASTAQRLWPGVDPIGRQLRSGSGATASTLTVIGVAADARHRGRFRFSQGAAAHEAQLDIYLSYAQRPNGLVTLGVRTVNDPASHTRAVAAAIAAIDPTLPVYDIATLDARLRKEESSVRFAALVMNIYGGLALLLAAIGIYGVLAAGISARRRELGIRAALGAQPRRLLGDVLQQGMVVVALALAAGAGLAWGVGRLSHSLLFEVSPTDPRWLGAAATIVILFCAVATLLAAQRAARVDPVQVLRSE